MTRFVLGAIATLCMTIGMSQWGVWLYLIAGIIAFTRRLIREFRRAYQAVAARKAADEAAREAADRLAKAVDVRRIARGAALARATRRAA